DPPVLYYVGVCTTALAAALGLLGPSSRKALCVAAMVAGYLTAGASLLLDGPPPGVDVVVFQRDACDAVLAGRSPYGITFPDISPPGSTFYADGLSRDGRLQFGFPYPPLSLLLVLPAHVAGDF